MTKTKEIRSFMSQPTAVPYATLETLRSYTKEQIAKLGEATFDEVVQLKNIREKIFKRTKLIG